MEWTFLISFVGSWLAFAVFGLHKMNWSSTISIGGGFIVACLASIAMTIAFVGPESSPDVPRELAASPRPTPAFSDEVTSYSRTGEVEDFSYGDVKRVSQRIVVPLGRTRDQLTATLQRAARELANETKANAVMVFAYRPQDTPSGQFSAGRAVLAPNGRWEEASSSAQMVVAVDLGELYFVQANDGIAPGMGVTLRASPGGMVDLSISYGSWMDEDIIARVPAGTEARIIERRSEPMGNQEFVRYRVQLNDVGPVVDGWVHRSNVEGE